MARGDGLKRLIEALEERGSVVRGRSAQCPAHEDREASLSIGQGRAGAVLRCHADCTNSAVFAALGLAAGDLFDEPRGGERDYVVTATYTYTDECGEPLFFAERRTPKGFRQYRIVNGHKEWSLGGTRRVLYRLPKVIEAVKGGETVWVAEGEKDVHALEAAGVVATCNPMGAGKWRPEFAEVLDGASEVIVVADRDPAGRKHAAEIAASLDRRALVVTVVEAAEGKDAADHLAAGHTLDDFQEVQPVSDTSNNPLSENSGILTRDNNTSNSSGSLHYEMRDGAWLNAQHFSPLAYVVPGLMPAGLGIIAAPPKAGKSLLILDWLLALATGGLALGTLPVGSARDVLYLALEDGDRRLQARCHALLADGEDIPARLHYILAVQPGEVLAVLRDALARHPDTALIVIDTLGKIMPLPQAGETTYQRDYRVAVALKRIADEHPGLSIVVIHHTRKAFSDDFIDSISGTHGLAGAADTIIALTRGRGKGEGVLQVTGRDVIEASYAVTFSNGVWALDGDDLKAARATVSRREKDSQEAAAISPKMKEILDYVREQPDGAAAKQVREKFKGADSYLKRLLAKGLLSKPERGLYIVSEVSEVSDSQVSDGKTSNSPLSEVSETLQQDDMLGGWAPDSIGAEERASKLAQTAAEEQRARDAEQQLPERLRITGRNS